LFKSLSQTLHEQFGGSPLTPTLDPVKVARNFGVALEVGESLHESSQPIRHLEDEQQSALLLDNNKTPTAKPEPKSLFVIATTRLRSIEPRTKERAQQVAQLIADSQETLNAIDEMVATLEQERVEATQQRLDELRTRGREQRHRVNNELRGKVNTSLMNWNEAERNKVQASTRLQSRIDIRRALRLDRYSSDEQLAAADEKVASAVRKLNAAKAVHLEAEKKKADAENNLALGQSALRAIEIAMDQCLAELKGQTYHDPTTGLSLEPIYLQQ
jgi:hypothetical protein